jgi:uncharacterized protein (TIGR03083 family)
VAGTSFIWCDVHAERKALVDDLAALDAPSWETPSLCVGWAVRDVVAHLAATAILSRVGFVREFVRARFSVDRVIDRQVALARKHDASASLTALHSAVNCVVSPPLPLITRVIETVVHGEDIRRPLGMRHLYSTTCIANAVAYLAGDRRSDGMQRLEGLSLTANDAAFSISRGPSVRGPAVALLMAASGRSAALDELSGPGAGQLTDRVLEV